MENIEQLEQDIKNFSTPLTGANTTTLTICIKFLALALIEQTRAINNLNNKLEDYLYEEE